MSYDNERDQHSWNCPHCGRNIWDVNSSVTDSYVEEEYYITEITCECGCECKFWQPIDEYPNYVQYDLPPREDEEDDEDEEDEVSSEVADIHRRICSLQHDISDDRSTRDILIKRVDNEYPAQMGRRMPTEALEQWREKRRQEIFVEYQEKIDMMVLEIEELQHQLTELEQAKAEEIIRNIEPVSCEGIRQLRNTATSKAEIWRNLQ